MTNATTELAPAKQRIVDMLMDAGLHAESTKADFYSACFELGIRAEDGIDAMQGTALWASIESWVERSGIDWVGIAERHQLDQVRYLAELEDAAVAEGVSLPDMIDAFEQLRVGPYAPNGCLSD